MGTRTVDPGLPTETYGEIGVEVKETGSIYGECGVGDGIVGTRKRVGHRWDILREKTEKIV